LKSGKRVVIKLLLAVIGLAIAFVSAPARSQVMLDVSKITCDQFAGYQITDPKNIAIWLSGYYNGKRGNTILDTQALAANVEKMEQYCFSHPDIPVMKAVEMLLVEKK
jgi:acid stress chaperone HdeB